MTVRQNLGNITYDLKFISNILVSEKKEIKKMTKEKDKSSEELRCDKKQYELLKRCSDKKDITEWNDYRRKNPDEQIWIQGANLVGANLQGVNLAGANLQGASLWKINLQGANLVRAKLQGASLEGAKLQGAKLWEAKLQKVDLRYSHLQGTRFVRAFLQGTEFGGAKLQRSDFSRAIVDGETLIWRCEIDRDTKFEGVGLDAARIYPELKQLLEYNVRRMNWKEWYKKHRLLKWPVSWFWCLSNYGLSTWRIIIWFFGLALFFAAIYANCAYWWPPGIVSDLTVEPHLPIWHYYLLLILRPVYFSIVTMTTLGFGDMYANAQSIWGHLLLTVQVILGYVLLAALVTRFAVLFTAGGPAGSFTPMDKEAKQLLAEIEENRKKREGL